MQRWVACFEGPAAAADRLAVLRRVWALFALALFAATWRLWTPHDVFPQVPLILRAGQLPAAVEWLAGLGTVVSLLLAGGMPQSSRVWRVALWTFAACTALLWAIDQHRLQPWAYQFTIVAIVLALAPARQAFGLLRLLTVSIYVYSAVSKFDHTFVHTLGQQFLATLVNPLGVTVDAWPLHLRLAAALLFPLGELVIAAGLCFPRVRRAAVIGSVALHLLLVWILGPLGLGHRPGVLLWNVFFVAQNLLLFWPARTPCHEATAPSAERARSKIATTVVVAAVALPLLELRGWFDHWLAWGLYSPSAERVTVHVHHLALVRLPAELRRHARNADEADDWIELRIDRWSLETLGAPIYPQGRFQMGVAEALARRYRLGQSIQAVWHGPAQRWSGEREQTIYSGTDEIVAAADKYWLNAHPRSNWDGTSF